MRVARTLSWAIISCILIVSFTFSILSLTSSRWATVDRYVQIPVTAASDKAGQYVYVATDIRGPYHAINHTVTVDQNTGVFTNITYVNSHRICTVSAYPFGDFPWFCQQLTIGVKTLIAGSAFTGIAMLSAILATIATLILPRGDGLAHRVLPTLVLLTGVLGALGEGVGGLIVANMLVNQQAPDGDFISSTPVDPSVAHWVVGKGVTMVAVACLPTVIALTFLPSVNSTTRKGKHHGDHVHHHEDGDGIGGQKRRHWRSKNESESVVTP